MFIFNNENLCSLSQWKALSSSSTDQTSIMSAESCLLALTTTSPHPNQSECTTDSFSSQTYSIWTLHFLILFIFYAHFISNKCLSRACDPHPLYLSLINLSHDDRLFFFFLNEVFFYLFIYFLSQVFGSQVWITEMCWKFGPRHSGVKREMPCCRGLIFTKMLEKVGVRIMSRKFIWDIGRQQHGVSMHFFLLHLPLNIITSNN